MVCADSLGPTPVARATSSPAQRDRPPGHAPETRLHHLIDAEELDAETLVRLAGLDGATVVDRAGRLLAYGAIVTSSRQRAGGGAHGGGEDTVGDRAGGAQ